LWQQMAVGIECEADRFIAQALAHLVRPLGEFPEPDDGG
jgi:hypothetical protein